MKWGLKGGISIDTDSGPLGYVLRCCGSRSQDFFTSGHTVVWNSFDISLESIFLSHSCLRKIQAYFSNLVFDTPFLCPFFYLITGTWYEEVCLMPVVCPEICINKTWYFDKTFALCMDWENWTIISVDGGSKESVKVAVIIGLRLTMPSIF